MSRIPASAGVVLAGLLPMCAAGLGLGEIESRSYLNQPLAAEIPLFSDAPEELTGLQVGLASAETFAQFGLPRPAEFAGLRFAVVSGDGRAVIRVTSTAPVSEPFLTLLLELNWPQGRLLREFTVLLDPPDFASGSAGIATAAWPAEGPAPAKSEAGVAESAAEQGGSEVAVPAGGDSSHTVQRNETLWGIAERYHGDGGVALNQAMVAIYRANPQAFAGNMNRLRAGAVLRIPDRTAVGDLSGTEADDEVARQNLEWTSSAGSAGGQSAARLELVPPAETPAPAGTTAARATAVSAPAAADLEEARRLLAVRDAELKALRDQLARLQGEPAPSAATPGEIEAEVETEAPPPIGPAAPSETTEATPPREVATPPAQPSRPAAAAVERKGGVLALVQGLLTSVWLWLAAAVVLVAALLVTRRRAGTAQEWQAPVRRGAAEVAGAAATVDTDSMIVQEEPARTTGRFERRQVSRGDEESPLERTLSTDGAVNLDQSDPLAEADFHMAYGLYDQAADLLTAALKREPDRRDLRLKLIDVCFVWENREAFLREAHALRDRVDDTDPDWKRVLLLGQQLCPGESLFSGAATPAAEDMDLAFTDAGGGTVDLDIGAGGAGLDFDLGDAGGGEADSSAKTRVAPYGSAAQTQEIPTLEVPGVDIDFDLGATRETPTIESPALGSTLETPTVEAPMGERTVETPTIETAFPETGGTARLRAAPVAEERADQTAEIDLEDLGLDLTGLDEVARDMTTGLQEALPGDAALDLDLGSAGDTGDGIEATAELAQRPPLSHITAAMGKGEAGPAAADDTVEQPGAGRVRPDDLVAVSPTRDDLPALDLDLDLGFGDAEALQASNQADLTATGMRAIGSRLPEDPTMTEVGTKLDLARAYLDMGDPDGARSILNEVIEEGDPSQRDEARRLLDSLGN